MEDLIKSILLNNDFLFNESIDCFQNGEKSYFFFRAIDSIDLESIKSKSYLNESEWYRDFLGHFNQVISNSKYPALEKNSSLIILVNSTEITEIERLQTQILLLEEDPFYVKKYVVIYTDNALQKIVTLRTNEQLQVAINDRNKFQDILNNGLNTGCEDYILLLQLFIKLPFLTLRFSENEFISLPQKLNLILGRDYSLLNTLPFEQLQNIDFMSHDSESEIDNLLTLLENDSN